MLGLLRPLPLNVGEALYMAGLRVWHSDLQGEVIETPFHLTSWDTHSLNPAITL